VPEAKLRFSAEIRGVSAHPQASRQEASTARFLASAGSKVMMIGSQLCGVAMVTSLFSQIKSDIVNTVGACSGNEPETWCYTRFRR